MDQKDRVILLLFKAKHFTICAGMGQGKEELNAFDHALQTAGVGNYNLIRVSSILPPWAEQMPEIDVAFGSLLPIAYGSIISGKHGEEIAAAVGVGIPKNRENVGVIMEFSGLCGKQYALNQIDEMVKEAMKNRGIETADIVSVASSYIVEDAYVCAFAGIALW